MSILRSKTWIDIPDGLSIAELMQRNTSTTSDKIIYEEATTGRAITYGEFTREVRIVAVYLKKSIGVRPGQIVSIISSSCIDYLVAAHAVWWVGGALSTINDALHPEEKADAINLIKPSYVVINSDLAGSFSATLELCKHKTFRVLTIGLPGTSYPSIFPKPSDRREVDSQMLPPFSLAGCDARNTLAAILLSSGTTGRPKAVMLSHYNLVAVCHQLRYDNPTNWRGSQREIFFPPLSHVYGLYVCFTMCYWLGAYVCLMPRFDLELYCRLMQDRRATLARLVPPIAKLLSEEAIVKKYKYPSLEYFSCSAAPLNLEVAEKLSKVFPGVSLCQTYGCTELSGPCTQSGVRDKNLPLAAAGTLITNIEMRFLDGDDKDVGSHGPGEIVVRGPNIMLGYKDNAEATKESMWEGSWYRTGDLGYINDHGYLIIYDRIKDIIKYKGFQVSPAELEEILVRHPRIDSVAVVGVWSDADSSELPRAYVVLTDPVKSESESLSLKNDIQQFLSAKVTNYKRLRGGVIFLDALPKNSTGKVLRRVLRDQQAKQQKATGGSKL